MASMNGVLCSLSIKSDELLPVVGIAVLDIYLVLIMLS